MGKYAPTDPNHVFPNRAIPAATAERAYSRVTVDPRTGCWNSLYTKNAINNYHSVSWRDESGRDRATTAHRASYTHAHGPIPDGMVVDHLCHNRTCVNPAHLRLLTRSENARRQGPGDFPLNQCRNGHPLSEMRKRLTGRSAGMSYCGACQDEYNEITTTINTQIRLLEIAYGLGGHETKRNYAYEIRKRDARVAAVAAARHEGESGDGL